MGEVKIDLRETLKELWVKEHVLRVVKDAVRGHDGGFIISYRPSLNKKTDIHYLEVDTVLLMSYTNGNKLLHIAWVVKEDGLKELLLSDQVDTFRAYIAGIVTGRTINVVVTKVRGLTMKEKLSEIDNIEDVQARMDEVTTIIQEAEDKLAELEIEYLDFVSE